MVFGGMDLMSSGAHSITNVLVDGEAVEALVLCRVPLKSESDSVLVVTSMRIVFGGSEDNYQTILYPSITRLDVLHTYKYKGRTKDRYDHSKITIYTCDSSWQYLYFRSDTDFSDAYSAILRHLLHA